MKKKPVRGNTGKKLRQSVLMNKPCSLKDIARATGYVASIVSMVVYKANYHAQSLRRGRSNVEAALFNDRAFNAGIFVDMLAGINHPIVIAGEPRSPAPFQRLFAHAAPGIHDVVQQLATLGHTSILWIGSIIGVVSCWVLP